MSGRRPLTHPDGPTAPGWSFNPSPPVLFALLALAVAPAGALPSAARVRQTLRNDQPNRADYEAIERNYYEQILDAGAGRTRGQTSAAVAGALAGHAESIEIEHSRLTDRTADVREFILKPNLTRDPGRRIPWSTNAHGMRDAAYPKAKPANVFRIGLVGDSIAAGWGVGDEQGFEPLLEVALDSRSRASGGPKVEILNFAVPGHGPGQRWTHFDAIGWLFEPDLVVFEASPADPGWDERRLRSLLTRGIGFDAPVYRDALASAHVTPGRDAVEYKRALRPLRWALLENVYRVAAAECRSQGVPCVWVLVPRVGKPLDPADRAELARIARASGFDAVLDVCDAYNGADPNDLAVGPNDYHPNAAGHARIARALEPLLAGRPELARIWTRPDLPRGVPGGPAR
jgi:hypothetical protein